MWKGILGTKGFKKGTERKKKKKRKKKIGKLSATTDPRPRFVWKCSSLNP
jgi:hypothetical protein